MITRFCDLCEKELMEKFTDEMYKISVKRLQHSYDGYIPWIRKQTMEICEDCGFSLKTIAEQMTSSNAKKGK